MYKKIKAVAPSRLWKAIEIALADLIQVENDPKYIVHMHTWHTGTGNTSIKPCEVCFAGAVIAKTCKIPTSQNIDAEDFSPRWTSIFYALDRVRVGRLDSAISTFYLNHEKIPKLLPAFPLFNSYESNPVNFKLNVEAMAKTLKGFNL